MRKTGKCLVVYVYESVSFILNIILLLVHGFHMLIVTNSYGRSKRMSMSD